MNVKNKKIAVGCVIGGLILAAAGWSILAQGKKVPPAVGIISATAEKISISKSIQGTGTLNAENSSDMKVPVGIRITEVKVKLGDEVKAGDVLATVDGDTVSAELLSAKEKVVEIDNKLKKTDNKKAVYYNLVKEKRNLEEKINVLGQIAQTNSIVASVNGTVAAINGAVGDVQKTSPHKDNTESNTTGNGGAEKRQPMSAQRENGQDSGLLMPLVSVNEPEESSPVIPVEIVEIKAGTPVTGQLQWKQLEETEYYTGTIEWNHIAENFEEKTVYMARITLNAKQGYCFKQGVEPKVEGAEISDVAYTGEENIQSVAFTATYPETGEKEPEETVDPPKPEEEKEADSKEEKDETEQKTDETEPPVMGEVNSGSFVGGSNPVGSSSSESNAGEKEINTELVSVFTIASGDKMKVIIQVDEMDILSVAQNQKSSITLNALPGEKFEGQITHINKVGNANNGVTKYPVEITVAKNEKMMSGMNVSAAVLVEEKKDVLSVPAEAVIEEGGKSYVYTSIDKKTNVLSGKKEVTTGITDGTTIEIVEGITEGSKIHYTLPEKADSGIDEAMSSEEQMGM